jgi:uncharacterized protein with FMN-binding domain
METSWPAPTQNNSTAIDPLMQERLARLANRRTPVAPTARTNGPAPRAAANTSKRRHAAKKSRVAALVMSVSTTVGLSAYFYQLDAAAASARSAAAAATAVTPGVVSAGTASAGAASSAVSAANVVVAAAATGSTNTALKDGTYAGQTSTNRWGPVQVQITVAGGKITDVTALQTPSDNGRSQQINNYAAPILSSEAVQAQSAKIDTVSGATYTSNSYMKSLQSAIDVARSATAG